MAFTQIAGNDVWYEDQAAAGRAAPTAATDGVPADGIDAWTLVVEAEAGQTLGTTAGALNCYFYDPALGFWVRLMDLDLDTGSNAVSGLRRFGYLNGGANASTLTTLFLPRTGSRLCWVTNAVTVSGGTNVRVYLIGSRTKEQ